MLNEVAYWTKKETILIALSIYWEMEEKHCRTKEGFIMTNKNIETDSYTHKKMGAFKSGRTFIHSLKCLNYPLNKLPGSMNISQDLRSKQGIEKRLR